MLEREVIDEGLLAPVEAGRDLTPALEALELMHDQSTFGSATHDACGLTYLLMPADLIPDLLPVAGFGMIWSPSRWWDFG